MLTSCSLFDNKEKKAIEICQKAKFHLPTQDDEVVNNFLSTYGLGVDATCLDYTNMLAKLEQNKKYDWHANKIDSNKLYIVDYTDPNGSGHRWEVNIEQQIVKSINQSDYLTIKYGFSQFAGNDAFEVTEIQQSELKLDMRDNYFDHTNSSEICYIFKASVLNKTDKTITSASIDGRLQLIFTDKTITGKSDYDSGFESRVSKSMPWEPNTTKEFYIKTNGIEKIYLNYIPEYVLFDISLKAEDPIGYSFHQDIANNDIKEVWKSFKGNLTSDSE